MNAVFVHGIKKIRIILYKMYHVKYYSYTYIIKIMNPIIGMLIYV